MQQRKYYEAYDDRYRQVHRKDLQWFQQTPSAIVAETIHAFSISPRHKVLEVGCGEGRDAFALLEQGFDLLATDVSPEAIRFCRSRQPEFADRFQVLDCVSGELDGLFDFIFGIAVVHMLVPDEDRDGFYRFIREHLRGQGIALIGTMGDGCRESQSDIHSAFTLQSRIHQQTGTPVRIAGTSCRMVGFETFTRELERNGLTILRQGLTAVEPDFPQMMYAVVRRAPFPQTPPPEKSSL